MTGFAVWPQIEFESNWPCYSRRWLGLRFQTVRFHPIAPYPSLLQDVFRNSSHESPLVGEVGQIKKRTRKPSLRSVGRLNGLNFVRSSFYLLILLPCLTNFQSIITITNNIFESTTSVCFCSRYYYWINRTVTIMLLIKILISQVSLIYGFTWRKIRYTGFFLLTVSIVNYTSL